MERDLSVLFDPKEIQNQSISDDLNGVLTRNTLDVMSSAKKLAKSVVEEGELDVVAPSEGIVQIAIEDMENESNLDSLVTMLETCPVDKFVEIYDRFYSHMTLEKNYLLHRAISRSEFSREAIHRIALDRIAQARVLSMPLEPRNVAYQDKMQGRGTRFSPSKNWVDLLCEADSYMKIEYLDASDKDRAMYHLACGFSPYVVLKEIQAQQKLEEYSAEDQESILNIQRVNKIWLSHALMIFDEIPTDLTGVSPELRRELENYKRGDFTNVGHQRYGQLLKFLMGKPLEDQERVLSSPDVDRVVILNNLGYKEKPVEREFIYRLYFW